MASGYIAKHPEKVSKVVLAEPGMLTDGQAKIFADKFKIELTWNVLKTLVTIWFQSLHVNGPDGQAGGDYFWHQLATSELDENPMKFYFCNGKVEPDKIPMWRVGALASKIIQQNGTGEDGELHIDLVSGVENFNNKVLFLCGACDKIIGAEYQKEHMKYFQNAEMVIIENAGHYMISDQPEKSVEAIRNYFNE